MVGYCPYDYTLVLINYTGMYDVTYLVKHGKKNFKDVL